MKKFLVIVLLSSIALFVGVCCIVEVLVGGDSNSYSSTGSNYSTNNNSYYDSGNYNSGSSYSGSSYGGSSYSGGHSSGGSYSSSYDRDADYVAGQFGVSSDRVKDSVGALADAIR